ALEQDRELVAAAAPGDAPALDHLGDPAAQGAQRLIAGGVAVAVVDFLEPVDIEHDRAKRPPVAVGARERLLAEATYMLIVEQPGEAVAYRWPEVAAPLQERTVQQHDQQQRRRQQRHHARRQQPLPLPGGGDLERGSLL